MEDRKIRIEMTEEQMNLMIKALELYFRPMMNQWSGLAEHLAFCSIGGNFNSEDDEYRKEKLEKYLVVMGLLKKQFEGIGQFWYKIDYMNFTLPKNARNVSDMWSALRHCQWQLSENKHDCDVRSGKPMQLGEMPMIKVEIVKRNSGTA